MNRHVLMDALRRYGQANGVVVQYSLGMGRGRHGTVQVGEKFTVLNSGELSNVYIRAALRRLGLSESVLE